MTSSHTVDTEEVSYPSGQSVVAARLYRHGATGGAGIVVCAGRLRDIDGLDFLSRALAEAGYVVLAIRYRGMDYRCCWSAGHRIFTLPSTTRNG